MQYSTTRIEREISANGIEYDAGSVYDRLYKLTDLRGVNGKRYRLETVLMIVILAKLSGEGTQVALTVPATELRPEI